MVGVTNFFDRIENRIEDAVVSGAKHLVTETIPDVAEKLYESIPSARELYDGLPSARDLYDKIPSAKELYNNLPSAREIYDALPSASEIFKSTDDKLFKGSIASGASALSDMINKKVYNIRDLDLPEIELIGKSSDYFKAGDKSSDKGTDYHLTINHAGRERDYVIHTPPNFGKTAEQLPLVVVLHGFMQNADGIAQLTKFSEKADKENFIVAYPNATQWFKSDSLQAWDVDNGLTPPGADSDDVGFIKSMIDKTQETLDIDPNRIYAAGFSNGGMMTYKLASDLSDTLAAVAIVSGGMSGREAAPDNGVSVLHIHGTNDRVVPVDGRSPGEILNTLGVPHFQPVTNSLESWRKNVGITGAPEVVTRDGVTGMRSVNPETGQEVTAFLIEDGKHQWPGSDASNSARPGTPEANFPATDTIWEFFKKHPRTDRSPDTPKQDESVLLA